MPPRIKQDEWLAELESALQTRNDEGMTAKEIADRLHLNITSARKQLAAIAAQGRLIVGRRTITRIDGYRNTTPVYRIRRA